MIRQIHGSHIRSTISSASSAVMYLYEFIFHIFNDFHKPKFVTYQNKKTAPDHNLCICFHIGILFLSPWQYMPLFHPVSSFPNRFSTVESPHTYIPEASYPQNPPRKSGRLSERFKT